MNEIVRARISLVESEFLKPIKKRTAYEYKRQAIQNSIYGVDIEPGAVEIAKLRLWLSLVVDEDNIENIKPLPNLDYKIVCGNSLLGVQRNLFNDFLFRQLEELKPRYFNETKKSEKRRLKKQIDDIIKDLTKDGTFDFEIFFSEVFHEKGGFDIVIANPPYIEFKKLPSEQKILYSKFLTAKGKYDIYVLFIEKSCKLLKKNGVHTYINPTTFLMKDYGTSTRNFIKNNFQIVEIVDFADAQIFESATTYTGIFIFQKSTNTSEYNFIVQKFNNSTEVEIITLDNKIKSKNKDVLKLSSQKLKNEWVFSSEITTQLREKIELISQFKLKDITKYVFQGIATGKDEVFLIDEHTIKGNNLEKKLVHPILKGKDVSKYFLNWSKHYIIYPYDKNTNLPIQENELKINYPNIYNYLLYNREKLAGRDYFDRSKKLWYELWCERNYNKFNQTKIVSAEISPENRFCIDDKNFYLGNTKIFSTVLKDEYKDYYMPLLIILNSKLMNFYHKLIASPKAGGFYDYKTQFIEKYPIILPKNIDTFSNIAVVILEKYSSKTNAQKEECLANLMVYKLYDLTYDEVLVVDKEFSMSQQDYENYKL